MTKNLLFASVQFIAFARAFENKAGWKLDADGHLVLSDGNPVYVDVTGNELTVESGTISRLNGEAKTNRERAEKAETALAPFKDLDPVAAREAFDKLSKIDQKKLIDAGEVDKVREEVGKSFSEKLTASEVARQAAEDRANNLTKQTHFATSKFIANKIAVPADMFESLFGKNFKIEDTKLVPYDATGNKIYSTKRAGEIADFDEALEIIVGNYPNKDQILKAQDAGGSGNNGGGGGRGNGRTILRADFDKMTPVEQAKTADLAGKGEVVIAD